MIAANYGDGVRTKLTRRQRNLLSYRKHIAGVGGTTEAVRAKLYQASHDGMPSTAACVRRPPAACNKLFSRNKLPACAQRPTCANSLACYRHLANIAETQKLSSEDKANIKLVAIERSKTNFGLIIDRHSSINPANLEKIGPFVYVEIIALKTR